jgi:hypothetical protein
MVNMVDMDTSRPAQRPLREEIQIIFSAVSYLDGPQPPEKPRPKGAQGLSAGLNGAKLRRITDGCCPEGDYRAHPRVSTLGTDP